MAYSTQADVQRAAGGEESLTELADLDDDGVIDVASLDLLIAEVDELIDSYLGKRYAIPLATVPAIVRRMSADIVVYKLKEQRRSTTSDDDERHAKRIDWLDGVSFGRILPGIDPPPSKSSIVNPATGSRTGREDLKGLP